MASIPEISSAGYPRLLVSNIPAQVPKLEVALKTQFRGVEILNVEADAATGTAFVTLAGPQGVQQLLTREYFIGGRKLKISYLRSESASLMLHKPTVTGITTEQIKQLADKWQLRCTNQEGKGVIVSGLRERISHFRFDLDYYQSLSAHCGTLPLGQSGTSMDQQAFTQLNANPDHTAQGNAIPNPAIAQLNGNPGLIVPFNANPTTAGAEPQAIPPTPTTGSETSQVFSELSPDALALLKKIPEGEIQGVEYNPEAGTVMISCQSKDEVEDRISKFQVAYQKILSSRRLKAEPVEVPPALDGNETASLVTAFNHQYNQTVFTYHPDLRVIKVVSVSSRQFDQAKKQLLDRLHSREGSAEADMSGIEVILLTNGRKLTLKKANIVEENVHIIVNAANGQLKHWGGVAGALNKASHGQLQRYSDSYMQQRGHVPVGHIAVTHGGGALNCHVVIHAVGPDHTFSQSECKQLLAQAIRRSFFEAEKYDSESIAFPAISSGIFGVSKDLVAQTMIDTILNFKFNKSSPVLSDIRIVIIDHPTYSCFAHHFRQKQAALERAVKPEENTGVTTGEHTPQNSTPQTSQSQSHDGLSRSTSLPDGEPTTKPPYTRQNSGPPQSPSSEVSPQPQLVKNEDPHGSKSEIGKISYPTLAEGGTESTETLPVAATPVIPQHPGEQPPTEGPGPSTKMTPTQLSDSPLGVSSPVTTQAVVHNTTTTCTDATTTSNSGGSGGEDGNTGSTSSPTYSGVLTGAHHSHGHPSHGHGKDKEAGKKPIILPSKQFPGKAQKVKGGATTGTATATTDQKCEGAQPKQEECPICFDSLTQPEKTPVQTNCGHKFCRDCLNKSLKHSAYCPICKAALRAIIGNQPENGTMSWKVIRGSLPGYHGCGIIEIHYHFPTGTQGQGHPNPGQRYSGTSRAAYLPNNAEGVEVLQLLKKAFDARLVFTVGTSVTTGKPNTVVWNDVHHKTNISGGQTNYGYPDPTYLQRVKQDLAARGIVSDFGSTV